MRRTPGTQMQLFAMQNAPLEWGHTSGRAYADPFNDLDIDAEITGPGGRTWRLPAYWAGGQEWWFRFAAPEPGEYRIRTTCTDTENAHLHGREAALSVTPYEGTNPLYRHGGLRVSANRTHLEHADGTPF